MRQSAKSTLAANPQPASAFAVRGVNNNPPATPANAASHGMP